MTITLGGGVQVNPIEVPHYNLENAEKTPK